MILKLKNKNLNKNAVTFLIFRPALKSASKSVSKKCCETFARVFIKRCIIFFKFVEKLSNSYYSFVKVENVHDGPASPFFKGGLRGISPGGSLKILPAPL